MQHPQFRFHLLLHSADLLEDVLRERLSAHGILPRQARILDALRRFGSASQAELAAEFDVTAGSMSSMIARLASTGLVSRTKHPDDRRTDMVELTPAGQDKLDAIHAVWKEMDSLVERTIGTDRSERLAQLCSELKIALGGRMPYGGSARREHG